MPNSYVDALNELLTRLTRGKTSGSLTAVKSITIGKTNTVEGDIDFPNINIVVNGISDLSIGGNKQNRGTMNITLKITDKNVDTTQSNLLFNTGDSTGILYLIENILDEVYEDVSGSVCGISGPLMNPEIGAIETRNNIISCEISLTVSTARYQINERS